MNNLLNLLQLSDPVLPIGSFAHSHGLETYVQKGLVRDKSTAMDFIFQMLSQNLLYTDAAFVSLSYDAAMKKDIEELKSLDVECTAVKIPKEIRQASQKLGNRLLKIFPGVEDNALVNEFKNAVNKEAIAGNYSIVFGLFAANFGIDKSDTLTGFYYNAVAGMVTNSVKLVPLGQLDGQKILLEFQPLIKSLVSKSLNPDKELIGLCCPGFDIRCMQHESLYSRLYMS
ncbi:MAG: urease accessory protein UreF [Flavitalea sp.]